MRYLYPFASSFLFCIVCLLFLPTCLKKEDIITPSTLHCEILCPLNTQEFFQGDTIHILVQAQEENGSLEFIKIYVDAEEVTSCNEDICKYEYLTASIPFGIHTIKAICQNNRAEQTTVTMEFYLFKNPDPPKASFTVSQDTANVLTEIIFDASGSFDMEDSSDLLEVRWDWDNDGIWDTDYSRNKLASKYFLDTGQHIIRLEVTDTDMLAGITSKTVWIKNPGHPCPGLAELEYEGQIYHTIQIKDQCWFRENLNVGIQINSGTNQSDNNSIEKYCFENQNSNCEEYGGLYQWDELMNYDTVAGAQGICPTGWHIPSDKEWCILSVFLDPFVSCSAMNSSSGLDCAGRLKETGYTHWQSPNYGATNESGFTAIAAGNFHKESSSYGGLKFTTHFWSSTKHSYSETIKRQLWTESGRITRSTQQKLDGLSVRCIKD